MCGCKTSSTSQPQLPLPKCSLPTPPEYYSSQNIIDPLSSINQLYFSINSTLDDSKLMFYGKYNIDIEMTQLKGLTELKGKQDITGNFEMNVQGSEGDTFWKEKCLWKNQVILRYAEDNISYQALPEDAVKFIDSMVANFSLNENTTIYFTFDSADDFDLTKDSIKSLLTNQSITSKLEKINFNCKEQINLSNALSEMNPVKTIGCSTGFTNYDSIAFILNQNVEGIAIDEFQDELINNLVQNKKKMPKKLTVTVDKPQQLVPFLNLLQSECVANVEQLCISGYRLFDNGEEQQKQFGQEFFNSQYLNLKKLTLFANFENFGLQGLFEKPKFQNLTGLELWDMSEASFQAFSELSFPQLEQLKAKIAGFMSKEKYPKTEKCILNILKNNTKLKIFCMDKIESILSDEKEEGLHLDFSSYSYMTPDLLMGICSTVGSRITQIQMQFDFMIMLGETIGTLKKFF